ncbi:MAG: hypothetical protein AB1633_05665 [Elusimicrobiota bacterium]
MKKKYIYLLKALYFFIIFNFSTGEWLRTVSHLAYYHNSHNPIVHNHPFKDNSLHALLTKLARDANTTDIDKPSVNKKNIETDLSTPSYSIVHEIVLFKYIYNVALPEQNTVLFRDTTRLVYSSRAPPQA